MSPVTLTGRQVTLGACPKSRISNCPPELVGIGYLHAGDMQH
jgi:hypothetical protein